VGIEPARTENVGTILQFPYLNACRKREAAYTVLGVPSHTAHLPCAKNQCRARAHQEAKD